MASPELTALARSFVNRAKSLNLKGKKRDNAAMEFIVGAWQGASLAGNEKLAEHFGVVAALIISVRGYSEFERIVNESEVDTQPHEPQYCGNGCHG